MLGRLGNVVSFETWTDTQKYEQKNYWFSSLMVSTDYLFIYFFRISVIVSLISAQILLMFCWRQAASLSLSFLFSSGCNIAFLVGTCINSLNRWTLYYEICKMFYFSLMKIDLLLDAIMDLSGEKVLWQEDIFLPTFIIILMIIYL